MFKLIRRISSSFIPRPDRPWEEDPTSNAPTRRKRRLSSTEPEFTTDEEGRIKRLRGDSESKDDPTTTITATDQNGDSTPLAVDADNTGAVQRETSVEVKSVTEGVKEVELDDKPTVVEEPTTTADSHPETENAAPGDDDDDDDAEAQPDSGAHATEGDVIVHPESIPLPGEEDESDDLASSSPPPAKEEEEPSVPTTETNTIAIDETITAELESTIPTTPSSSPGKRPPRTRASASPRKLASPSSSSQSPQKLSSTTTTV